MSDPTGSRASAVRVALDRVRRRNPGYLDMQRLIDRYAIERFLYRVGRSRYAGRLVLKGAMLLAVYLPYGHRSTRDADFLGHGYMTVEDVRAMIAEILSDPQDDGLSFNPAAMEVQRAGTGRRYPGFAVTVPARLGGAPCDISIDIGLGEAVVPAAERVTLPTILAMPAPTIRVYPLVVVVSEKFEAMVSLGMSNSRLKDLADLAQIALHCTVEGPLPADAISATFSRRGSPVPTEPPIALTDAFWSSRRKQADWLAFLKRHSLSRRQSLEATCADIERLVMPVSRAIAAGEPFTMTWRDGAWQ